MTNRYSPPNRSLIDQETVIPWINMSGEEIPAFGVIQLRQNFDETSKADKPDGTSGLFFVNGPVLVRSEADTAGESYLWDKPRRVLLAADAVVGDEVGPTEDSWEMSLDGVGWRVLRQAIDGVGVVVQTGGGGGGTHVIWFTIDQVLCPDTDYVEETTLVVTPTWYSLGCEAEPPGADEYGVYRVYDICSYFNGLTAEEMANTLGRATWMYPLTGYCEPRWIVDDLCAQPECNDPEEE